MFSPTILIVDDDTSFRRHLVRLCRQTARDEQLTLQAIQEAGTFDEAVLAMDKWRPDVVFLDFMLPSSAVGAIADCGFDLLRQAREANPLAEAIMMSAVRDDAASAVEALTEKGAFYFFVKDRFESRQLQRVLAQAIDKHRLAREVHQVKRRPGHFLLAAEEVSPLDRLTGSSEEMSRIRHSVRRVAGAPTNVLILGETGTGKELLARAIHYHSTRRPEPFVAVNCSAVPETLWESQFFGHTKGAFTGAYRDQPGLLEEAGRGTLFLDEVGDISIASQAKLLRALEDGQFRPVGSTRAHQMEARIVAATKRPLQQMVKDETFRDDLYYRLEGWLIEVPRLADRGGDVLEIARELLLRIMENLSKRDITIQPEADRVLLSHSWPGNVRELANIIERCVLMLDSGEVITGGLLLEQGPFRQARSQHRRRVVSRGIKLSVAALRRETDVARRQELVAEVRGLLEHALAEAGHNVSKASSRLGLSRNTLYAYMKEFEV